jgi:ubiquitin C-terminal hydrolase
LSYEPLKVNERARDFNLPSGLKNIGQTCYFNSLVQPLFFMPNIQEKIINFNSDEKFTHLQPIEESKMSSSEKEKLKSSKVMVRSVQKLFAQLLLSNVKYQDPTAVLENIVDESGHKIPIYEQKDIGEFFTVFLERLQDGLGENKVMIRKLMGEDLAKTMDINAQNSDLLGLS